MQDRAPAGNDGRNLPWGMSSGVSVTFLDWYKLLWCRELDALG
jgi:hypothetical protein